MKAYNQLLDQLADAIKSRSTFLRFDAGIVFVCGATYNGHTPTARENFLLYAKKNIEGFHFFLAEDFFRAFPSRKDHDLLSLENELAKYSDCIILFLESTGTFAELGAFISNDALSKISLIVNDIRFENSDSFVTLGPIAKANKVSKFKPAIHIDFDRVLKASEQITHRLSTIEREYGKRIDFSGYNEFLKANPKDRAFFLCDIVSLLGPLSLDDMSYSLRQIYETKFINVEVEFALLEALGLIRARDGLYYRFKSQGSNFYTFRGLNYIKLRSEVINHYSKNNMRKIIALTNE